MLFLKKEHWVHLLLKKEPCAFISECYLLWDLKTHMKVEDQSLLGDKKILRPAEGMICQIFGGFYKLYLNTWMYTCLHICVGMRKRGTRECKDHWIPSLSWWYCFAYKISPKNTWIGLLVLSCWWLWKLGGGASWRNGRWSFWNSHPISSYLFHWYEMKISPATCFWLHEILASIL